jgi:hypothetical protein
VKGIEPAIPTYRMETQSAHLNLDTADSQSTHQAPLLPGGNLAPRRCWRRFELIARVIVAGISGGRAAPARQSKAKQRDWWRHERGWIEQRLAACTGSAAPSRLPQDKAFGEKGHDASAKKAANASSKASAAAAGCVEAQAAIAAAGSDGTSGKGQGGAAGAEGGRRQPRQSVPASMLGTPA